MSGVLILVNSRKGVVNVVVSQDDRTFHSPVAKAPIEISRALPSRKALIEHTNLTKTILETRETFDVFAPTAGAILTNDEAMIPTLQRGVRFRFLLVDHSVENEKNLKSYFEVRTKDSDTLEESQAKFAFSKQRVKRLLRDVVKEHTGQLEVRLWRGPFTNSLWVRDGGVAETRLAHIELGLVGDSQLSPSFRFGALSPESAIAVQRQFNTLWEMAVPFPDDSE